MKRLKIIMMGPCLEEKGGMGKVSKLILENTCKSIEIRHISTWNGKRSSQYLASYVKVFLQAVINFLIQLIQGKVDLVHLHLSEKGSFIRKSILILIAWAFHKPIILHTHGAEFHIFYNQLSTPLKKIVNFILKQCTYVIVLSESWKQFYIKNCHLSEDRVILLYNPVSIPSQIPNRSNSPLLNFVFLGKIDQRKGIYDLLKAFATLPIQQQNQVNLILAGTGEDEQARQLAKTLGIEKNVQFPGWINERQRDNLLAKAHVFLLPSYQEGLPMALLEAMSWELPCITTPVGGIPEVITDGETGLLVEPGNIEQLATTICSLTTDESLRLRLGKAARNQVKCFDIKIYNQSLFKLYWAAFQQNQKSNTVSVEPISNSINTEKLVEK
ncbi:glycosyltransferase family 4 protein [Lyngbya sp. PCC 8106]|uniref:glycosyltransferase family 4 protein n=1 Tax=Lyngbya sp. (strain PCC 8106) TaxID=313612 RepID=UPI0003185437|nr:glycosyltransferase family 4 protein [Lyngbya sp. PCC 8106]